jgi:hypothetical protein
VHNAFLRASNDMQMGCATAPRGSVSFVAFLPG